jgi:catechol 2,3-dioxygenase-like lactoylglutathione lyase family enzyme
MAEHITHLRLVSIPVADVDRAKGFYVDMLGFEERFDGPFGDGMRWVELAPPHSQATIALVTWFDSMPPGSITGMVLDTPDARHAYEVLQARGVEFTGELRMDPWGTSASFVDPDGNGWVLMQTPER